MTPTKSSADNASSTSTVQDLLEQRSQIQRWLTNLDTVGTEANSRVVERVRNDYSDRLDAVIEELAEHLETIRTDRDERQQQLEAANQRLQSVTEELEEARLRHMIGEISDDAWGEREPDLGDAVTEAEANRDDARAEVARLDELLRQIEEDQNAAVEEVSPPAE
jgi:chromosome segregation ATPase